MLRARELCLLALHVGEDLVQVAAMVGVLVKVALATIARHYHCGRQ